MKPSRGGANPRGVAAAVVHVTVDLSTVDLTDVLGKEFGDIFIRSSWWARLNRSRKCHGTALASLHAGIVIAEPVQVGELLGGQLIETAIRAGAVLQADEIVQVQRQQGIVCPLVLHGLG